MIGQVDERVLSGLPIEDPELFDQYLYRFSTQIDYGRKAV